MAPGEEEFLEAILNREPVQGLTHDFYRYPARFSPLLAKRIIEHFTNPGDTILDPFVGGGTSLVEARVLGRNGIGLDISSLAVFISLVKTTPLENRDVREIETWSKTLLDQLMLRNPAVAIDEWERLGYQRNINDRQTWPIRKTLQLGLEALGALPRLRQRRFARCALLKTAQWALDCRKYIPSASKFREELLVNFEEMLTGAVAFSKTVEHTDRILGIRGHITSRCIHRSAVGMENDPVIIASKPKLVLTSPPYPGVHVLYHRWQVKGRRETPAPFWLASSPDGHGAAFYTFGNREQKHLTKYWAGMLAAFESLRKCVTRSTTVVQVLAFSDPQKQLPQYLSMMENAGFQEISAPTKPDSSDGRLWRQVPNRKWYASQRGIIDASREVVLFHRPCTNDFRN